MRLLASVTALGFMLLTSHARAEDHDPPVRRRADPALFGVGLATAITGGVAMNVGLGMALLSPAHAGAGLAVRF